MFAGRSWRPSRRAARPNPILYMVNSFRFGFRGVSDIGLGTAIMVILFFIVILFAFCMTLLKRGTGIRH